VVRYPSLTAIALKSGTVRAFFCEKAQKQHGRMRRTEGCIRHGDVVAFVEDVTNKRRISPFRNELLVEQLGCTICKKSCAILDSRGTGLKSGCSRTGIRLKRCLGRVTFVG